MFYKKDIIAVVCLLFIAVGWYFLNLSIKEVWAVGVFLICFVYLCYLISDCYKALQIEIIKAKDEILDELKDKNKE
jgi:predicted membrane channel-forming protein YqfA (hemolysin III family)